MNWLYLAIAIISEVLATSALKAANGFANFLPSVIVVCGYGLAFFLLSLTLRTIPVGVAYAIWSGAGIVLVSLAAWLVYGQRLQTGEIAGIALILAGVIVLNVFSKPVGH